MSKPLLALNTGNTRLGAGLFPSSGPSRFESFSHDSLSRLIDWVGDTPEGLDVVSLSVNPSIEEKALEIVGTGHGRQVYRVGLDVPIDVPNKTRRPETVGLDRLLNVREAFRRFGASLVVDFGSAITFDVVNAEGEFLGGAIAPGLGLGARALGEFTAKLPRVSPRRPQSPLGLDTEEAILSGLFFTTIGGTRTMIQQLLSVLGTRPAVVATGGDAYLLVSSIPEIERVHPHLTLESVVHLFEDLYGRF